MKNVLLVLTLFILSGQLLAQQLLEKTITHDGLERRYLVYVPAAYDGSEAWPVVLNFHELNSIPEEAMVVSGMNEIADTAHFLVVYPEAIVVPNFGVPGVTADSLTLWNDGFLPDTGIDDVGFTNNLIDAIAADYQTDLSRVYATGFGSGGGIAGRLACELNHRIAAIADVEGFIGCLPDNPIPTLIMFGTADPFVPFEGGGPFPAVMDFVNGWAAANGCSNMPDTTMLPDINAADSSTVTLLTYNDCDAQGPTVFYRIDNGGRSYPGADPSNYPPEILAQIGNINQDINASSEAWNFLKQFNRPQPQLLEKTITIDGLEREYLLYVPAAYDGSEEWPLVFSLHGGGSNAQQQYFIDNFASVADTAHFLVAYPEGILNVEGLSGWNVFSSPDLQDDVAFINEIINAIAGEYQLDLNHIYSTGLSNGAGMSVTLSNELSARIAAIATVAHPAGLPSFDEFPVIDPGRPFPIMVIQGTTDLIVPFTGGRSVLPDIEVTFPNSRETIEYWVDFNGCMSDPSIVDIPDTDPADSSTVTLERYTNCDASTEIAYYVIENGGHTWPDGPAEIIPPGLEAIFGNINRDINASSEIWNFFNRHSLPEPPQPQLLEKTITVDGLEREYLLYVPAAYDGSEEWPLVLNFHGYLSFPEEQIAGSRMNAVADTAHFLVAYPAGLEVDVSSVEDRNPNLPDQGPGWNIYGELADHDDLAFVNGMLDEIDAEYGVNDKRVYATGISFGGIMSHYLACVLNDRIAAIGSVVGGLVDDERFVCNPDKPVPVLIMTGTDDPISPYDGGIEGLTVQFWLENNGCATEPTITNFEDINPNDGSTVTSFSYDNCDANTEVLFYRMDGGGHVWPGVPFPSNFGNSNFDINGSSEIWNFFNRHELSEPTTGVEDGIAEFDRLSIFPNPATASTQIRLTMKEEAAVLVTLRNLSGEVALQRSTGLLSLGYNEIDLDLSSVPNGTYFLTLTSRERVSSSMLVVLKNY